ncbi:MAG: RNA-binding S4 domain-containing protein [Maricaulaceae bacterium]|jgi:ribosome-associated heat shock protein Hsp15
MSAPHPDHAIAELRLDLWLWRARFFKTRTLATRFVDTGRVRVIRDGEALRGRKPSFAVMVGDVVTFARRGRVVSVEIAALPARRGPASEARGLYLDQDLGQTEAE